MSQQASHSVRAPSEVAPPTQVDSLPQQGVLPSLTATANAFTYTRHLRDLTASTMPGDGSEVRATGHVDPNDPNLNIVEVPAKPVSWKDQVIGA
jgi:hypothetical protein